MASVHHCSPFSDIVELPKTLVKFNCFGTSEDSKEGDDRTKG